ncbi:MAG: PAS domain S-box protein [Bacteroidales bacterium]|nr:PAS domain S-box protein [Bacteroidales bacterium]
MNKNNKKGTVVSNSNHFVSGQDSDIMYDDLFRSIRDSILIANTERKIIDCNPAFLDLFGYTREEILGKETSYIYKNIEEFSEMGRRIKEKMGDPNFLHTIRYNKKNGEIFPGETNVFYLRNRDGEIEGFIGMIRDITDRIKAKKELFKSKESFRTTLNSIGDGVITTDLKGRITGMNPVACDLTGWSYEDCLNKPIEKVFRIENAITGATAENPVKKVLETGFIIGLANHTKLISKNGRELQISDSSAPIKDSKGNITGVVMVFRDVTEEYEMQEKLVLSEQKHRALVESVKAIVWEYDIVKDRWTYISPQVMEHTGWQPEEWTNLEFWTDKVHPDDRNESLSYCFACTEKGESHELEYRFRKKDGSYIWLRDVVSVEMDGEKPSVLRGFMFDITDRKNDEKEIEEKTEFISRVMDNLPIGVAINKMDTGTAIYMNRMFQETYGWGEEHIKDIATFFEKVYPDKEYRAQLQSRITEDIASGDSSRMRWENVKVTRSDGTEAFVDAVNIPLPEQNIMVSTVLDVTARKHLIDDIIDAKEKAEEHDRLKSAFLANISHEIRTPMNGILGFTELLKTPELSGNEKDHYIDVIQQSGDRMLDTINDLIDISKIETGQVDINCTRVDINEILGSHVEFFKLQAEKKGIKLYCSSLPEGSERYISTDISKLNSIITNLIKNAIKFTDEGEVEIRCEPAGNNLEFTVRDSGIGISADQHDKIFERFVQSDNNLTKQYEGSGIGLSIVKAYVNLLGGNLILRSEKSKGSTFIFTLPLNKELKQESNQETVIAGKDQKSLKNLKILIAEDDEPSYHYLQIITRDIAETAMHAQTGQETLDLFGNNPDTDLILMDIRMPGMDGIEATRRIREFNGDIVIIAQTAHAMPDDREKAIEAGCNDYISKPVNRKALMDIINTHLRNK